MNVYFYNPCYLKADKFPILAEILRVKRVIDLTEPNTRNSDLVKLYQPMAIYIRQSSDIEQSIRDAVYKFNEPICKPIIKKGNFIGEFIVNDLYKDSNAYNPIYNLEKCNDENTFVFCNIKERAPLMFTKLSLNILRKYAKKFLYENKLCFNFIGSFFEVSSTYFKENFNLLNRSIITLSNPYNCKLEPNKTYNISKIDSIDFDYDINTNFHKNVYSPLLSYLHVKYKDIYLLNECELSLTDVFLNNEGKNEWQKIINEIFISKVKKKKMIEYEDDINEECELEAWETDSEIKYIRSNGGDWIDD